MEGGAIPGLNHGLGDVGHNGATGLLSPLRAPITAAVWEEMGWF